MIGSPIEILLVEDNPRDTRLIREMLAEVRDTQLDLVCVERLSEGLERLSAGGIDVVLLDLSLLDSQGLNTFPSAFCLPSSTAVGLRLKILSGCTNL